MSIGREARWLTVGLLSAALLGGTVCVLLLNTDFPNWQPAFLVFPLLAATTALTILAIGKGPVATLPAAASTSYCTIAVSSWLWHAQVFTCSPRFTAFILRQNPGFRPPVSCSWSPYNVGAIALPVLLVLSVVVLILGLGRGRDWVAWGVAASVFSAFAVRAYWTSRLSPFQGGELPDWASLLLLFICVLAVAMAGAWRAGRVADRRSDGVATRPSSHRLSSTGCVPRPDACEMRG
jgi:hypothetical protein